MGNTAAQRYDVTFFVLFSTSAAACGHLGCDEGPLTGQCGLKSLDIPFTQASRINSRGTEPYPKCSVALLLIFFICKEG